MGLANHARATRSKDRMPVDATSIAVLGGIPSRAHHFMKTTLTLWAGAVVLLLALLTPSTQAQTCGLLVEESQGYWDLRHFVIREHVFLPIGAKTRESIRYSKLRGHLRRVQHTAAKIEAFAWIYSERDNYVHYSWGLYTLDRWGEDFVADFKIESYAHIHKNTVEWKTNVVAGPFSIYGLGSDIFGSRTREYVDSHGRPIRVTEDCSYSYILSNTNDVENCSKTYSFVAHGQKWSGMNTRQTLNIPHGETVVWTPTLCGGVLTATWLYGVGSYCETYSDGVTPPETGCMYGW